MGANHFGYREKTHTHTQKQYLLQMDPFCMVECCVFAYVVELDRDKS